jgi:hypothetical protein
MVTFSCITLLLLISVPHFNNSIFTLTHKKELFNSYMYFSCHSTYSYMHLSYHNTYYSLVVSLAFLIILKWKHIHYTFVISFTDCIGLITYSIFRELLACSIMLLTKALTITFHVPWLLLTTLSINFRCATLIPTSWP